MSNTSRRINRVEELCPGFKVAAGPYFIDPKLKGYDPAHVRMCRAALAEQVGAGVEAKVVMMGAHAFVIRDSKGWLDNDLRNLAERPTVSAPGRGCLRCLLCGRRPFLNEGGLRKHRCPKLPLQVMGDRVYHQRLSEEHVMQAVEAARGA